MKKIYFLTLLLVSGFSFAQLVESFSFTGGLTTNGWLTHSAGTTPGPLSTTTGSLSYSGITSSGNKVALVAGNSDDLNKAIPTGALTGVAYYSTILNVPNVTGLPANTTIGDYGLMFSTTTGTTSVTAFSGRIYIRAGSSANSFNIGVLNNSGGTAAPTFVATEYAVNAPIFIVVKYDLSTNTASLFVNPAIGGTEGTPTATNATGTTPAPTSIAAIALRQGGSATSGTGNVEFDEMRAAATYAAVTGPVLKTIQNTIDGLEIFPNPVTGSVLNINTSLNGTKAISVFDLLGKQVLSVTTDTNSINVSNLNQGIYFIKISEEGKTATRKLVVR